MVNARIKKKHQYDEVEGKASHPPNVQIPTARRAHKPQHREDENDKNGKNRLEPPVAFP